MQRVSVITPAFGAQGTLLRTVSSVVAQSYAEWEMVIVSDDGEDYERDLADANVRDRRLRFVSTGQVGTGPANARNVGLSAASGDIIALLDADDTFVPEKLELMVPLARSEALVSSDILFVDDPSGKVLTNHNRRFGDRRLGLEQALFANLHTYVVLVFDRRAVPARFDPRISLMADLVFLSSCFESVDHVYHMPLALHHYHHRGDSLCNQAGASKRFISECHTILDHLEDGTLGMTKQSVRAILQAFIERQLHLEHRFEAALAARQCQDYQEFLSRSPDAVQLLTA